MTICAPPGSVTMASGRWRASSLVPVGCSTKSQCSSMPASSTTRLSCSSPQRPRTVGWRIALARLAVSLCTCGSCVSVRLRSCSLSARVRVDARALDLAELAVDIRQRLFDRLHERVDGFLRARRDRLARAPGTCASLAVASCRNVWLVLSSASADSALKVSASWLCVLATSASFSAAARSCSSARACVAASSSRALPPGPRRWRSQRRAERQAGAARRSASNMGLPSCCWSGALQQGAVAKRDTATARAHHPSQRDRQGACRPPVERQVN